MNTFRKAFIGFAALVAAVSVSAAEIDGTWTGTLGQSEVKFVLKADGEKLTGTLDNAAQAGAVEIKEGKIKNGEVSFHVVRSLDNADTKVPWTGKLAGDELKLQRGAVGQNAAADVVLKRAKP